MLIDYDNDGYKHVTEKIYETTHRAQVQLI